MPVYEYKCKKCNKIIEKIQRMSDEPLTICKKCGGELVKLISRSSFKLVGEGFYCNDYSSGENKIDD